MEILIRIRWLSTESEIATTQLDHTVSRFNNLFLLKIIIIDPNEILNISIFVCVYESSHFLRQSHFKWFFCNITKISWKTRSTSQCFLL